MKHMIRKYVSIHNKFMHTNVREDKYNNYIVIYITTYKNNVL